VCVYGITEVRTDVMTGCEGEAGEAGEVMQRGEWRLPEQGRSWQMTHPRVGPPRYDEASDIITTTARKSGGAI
jgi:hypothetical protein